MHCPGCHHENPVGVNFCGECGARLEGVCRSCKASNLPANKFCGQCGATLVQIAAAPKFTSLQSYAPKHLAEKILTSKSALEDERKQVQFCSPTRKPRWSCRPSVMLRMRVNCWILSSNTWMEAVHRYEGTVNQVMGDGIMALFGAPLAVRITPCVVVMPRSRCRSRKALRRGSQTVRGNTHSDKSGLELWRG
jgi:hypothetical protein